MLKNHFITAYRNLLRNKIFSIINVFGLVIAMAVCMMIAEYIVFEKSFDKFHTHYKNLYRMVNVRHYLTHVDESAGCVVALGPALKETFPEVKNFTRCYKSERSFTVNNNPVKFRSVFSVDSTFLDLFSFDILSGPSKGILKKPNTAVLTQSSARTLFGDIDPIGKTILQGTIPYTVEAVTADVPENSHLKFDLLISFTTDLADPNYCVTCNNRNTYILLGENADPKALAAKMDRVVGILHPQSDMKREYKLQPLETIHLNSQLRMEHGQNGNSKSVLALTVVAFLLLVIAWLNYINLTTSIALSRSAEVGIRKVNGSSRKNLIVQFLTESLLINAIAFSIALLVAQVAFPFFCDLLGIRTAFTLLDSYLFWTSIAGTLLFGSLIYGFYPAFIVSSFKPLDALKGKSLLPGGVYRMRMLLVFMQFSFSIVLVAGTMVVYKQISYMKNMDLGFQIDQTVVVPIPNEHRDSGDAFAVDLKQHPDFENITYASAIPGENAGNVGGGFRTENEPSEDNHQVYSYYVNKNYFQFMSIDFLAGDGFVSDQLNNDQNTEIVINDAARKVFGFNTPEAALGKILYHDQQIIGRIKGIVKDHHNRSLDNAIMPTFFQYTKGKGYYLIKSNPLSVGQNLDKMRSAFVKHYPNYPFEYFFLDEYFNKQYAENIRFGKVFGFFTSMAIVIACLGLSGLTLYVIKLRSKEIALRKVLGAGLINLLVMLSKEYVRLTVVAFIVAAPIAYYLIENWLNRFSYHIDISWWMFVVPGLAVLVLALLIVSVQSLKTVISNPVNALRNE